MVLDPVVSGLHLRCGRRSGLVPIDWIRCRVVVRIWTRDCSRCDIPWDPFGQVPRRGRKNWEPYLIRYI